MYAVNCLHKLCTHHRNLGDLFRWIFMCSSSPVFTSNLSHLNILKNLARGFFTMSLYSAPDANLWSSGVWRLQSLIVWLTFWYIFHPTSLNNSLWVWFLTSTKALEVCWCFLCLWDIFLKKQKGSNFVRRQVNTFIFTWKDPPRFCNVCHICQDSLV